MKCWRSEYSANLIGLMLTEVRNSYICYNHELIFAETRDMHLLKIRAKDNEVIQS